MNYFVGEEENSVDLTFPLLNPADFARFSILVADVGRNPEFKVTARIVGITSLIVVNRDKEFLEKTTRIPWTVYPVGIIISFLILVIVIAYIPDFIKEKNARKRYRAGELIPSHGKRPVDYQAFINEDFEFRTSMERELALEFLKLLPPDDPVEGEHYESFEQGVTKLLFHQHGTRDATIVIALIILAGIWYLVATLS